MKKMLIGLLVGFSLFSVGCDNNVDPQEKINKLLAEKNYTEAYSVNLYSYKDNDKELYKQNIVDIALCEKNNATSVKEVKEKEEEQQRKKYEHNKKLKEVLSAPKIKQHSLKTKSTGLTDINIVIKNENTYIIDNIHIIVSTYNGYHVEDIEFHIDRLNPGENKTISKRYKMKNFKNYTIDIDEWNY